MFQYCPCPDRAARARTKLAAKKHWLRFHCGEEDIGYDSSKMVHMTSMKISFSNSLQSTRRRGLKDGRWKGGGGKDGFRFSGMTALKHLGCSRSKTVPIANPSARTRSMTQVIIFRHFTALPQWLQKFRFLSARLWHLLINEMEAVCADSRPPTPSPRTLRPSLQI